MSRSLSTSIKYGSASHCKEDVLLTVVVLRSMQASSVFTRQEGEGEEEGVHRGDWDATEEGTYGGGLDTTEVAR